jgi:hypothetical protein
MDTPILYKPSSADVDKNLVNVNVANLTGDVTHTIGGSVKSAIDKITSYLIANAQMFYVQIVWSGLDKTDAVFQVKTSLDGVNFTNENPDETTKNPTQVTLSTAAGVKIIPIAPSNYKDAQLYFKKGTNTVGNIDVDMIFKF